MHLHQFQYLLKYNSRYLPATSAVQGEIVKESGASDMVGLSMLGSQKPQPK